MKTVTMDPQIRQFARIGALAMCLRAVTEFPDILAELNAAANPKKVVLDGGPLLPSVSGAAVRRRRRAAAAKSTRKPWSAARRKAHSEQMKKRWAKKRTAK